MAYGKPEKEEAERGKKCEMWKNMYDNARFFDICIFKLLRIKKDICKSLG